MSLAKIPVVAIISLAFKAMLTSPQPDPPKGEEVPSATVDVSKARDIILTTSYVGQIVLAAAEIATILAYASPSSPLSQQLLSTLVFAGGDPSRLRLNISSILGAVLWLAGAALRMQAYQYMGKFFRFTVSIQKDHKLITTGPYAYVRHPSYSGLMLADIGWFLWNGSQGSWIRESGLWDNGVGRSVVVLFTLFFILSPPFVTFLRVAKEDDALKKQFGKEWLEWQKMCLIALSLVFISGRSYSVIRLKVMDGINAPTYFSLTVDREETVGDIGETASKAVLENLAF